MRELFIKSELDNGMLRVNTPPHTREVRHLDSCCNAVVTSCYWFLCKYFDESIESELVLSELSKLQDTDMDSNAYGCMKWYREEREIGDTNGAFFVLKPIAVGLALFPEKMTDTEREIVLPVLKRAIKWFKKECIGHGMYYPNKIVSDGAMLALLAKLAGDEDDFKEAEAFWKRWTKYTEQYGWGWGENTSATYSSIIIEAFDIAMLAFDKTSEVYSQIEGVREKLIDYTEFHGGYEFVPTIRSYNFKGDSKNELRINAWKTKEKVSYDELFAGVLHEEVSYNKVNKSDETIRKERIFGDSYAVTYKGKNVRLGCVTRFPVMPGSYQNEGGWGLGWQSMPVGALAVNHGFSFLRLTAVSQGVFRSNPAFDKQSGRFQTELFEDDNIPEIDTFCSQEGNSLVVVRQISHLANSCSSFADEWYVQNFSGEIKEIYGWFLFKYSDCAVAVKPVGGEAKIIRENKDIRLMQMIIEGEEEFRVKRFTNVAWAITAFDNVETAEKELEKIKVGKENIIDLRINHYIRPFTIFCGDAVLDYQPAKLNYSFL